MRSRTRHGARALVIATAPVLLTMLVVVACAADLPTDRPAPAEGAEPVPMIPVDALPTLTLTSEDHALSAEELASESSHPDELLAVLEGSGFAGAAQRSFGGGRGSFARVVVRGLSFTAGDGAAEYLDWFADHGGSELITARRIAPDGLPASVVALRHLPDGCCHNDVPVFLAAWRRGSSVLYVTGAGKKATSGALVDLVRAYDAER